MKKLTEEEFEENFNKNLERLMREKGVTEEDLEKVLNEGTEYPEGLHPSSITLGKNVRKMREENEWSIGQLAAITGIPEQRLTDIENSDTDANAYELYLLFTAFKTDANTLLGWITKKE